MNRYTAQGIAADISDGQHVVVIPVPYDTVQNLLHQINEYTDESYTSVSHAFSTITDESGGRVLITHNTERLRGLRIDVLVTPDNLDAEEFRFLLKPDTEIIFY